MMPRLNWKPDKPDVRDKVFHVEQVELPDRVDLRPLQSPVHDQGDIGSCTGNAIASAVEFLELKALREKLDNVPEEFGKDYQGLSRLFIYYNERFIEGTVGQDAGAEIRDGMKTLKLWGVCPESYWPYTDANALLAPEAQAYQVAARHRIDTYERLDNTNLIQLKSCLAAGFPFVMGFSVYSNFMSETVARTGIMGMPRMSDRLDGGHAVLCVGYDDSMNCAIIKNSWGTGWGAKGYFFMPYEYLTSADLASDFWTVRIKP